MAAYIWPEGNREVKTRVVTALSLLVTAKVLNTSVPFIFKYAVDTLNATNALNLETPEAAVVTMVTATLVGYGIARAGSRGISFVLSAMLFNIVPTILELSMVCGVLAYSC